MPETDFSYFQRNSKIYRYFIFWISALLFLPLNFIYCQEDTVQSDVIINQAEVDSNYHNPQKAAVFSAVLPGLGQIYNKKIWKVPIIYAGFATFGYLIKRNSDEYKLWRQAYIDYPDYHLDISYPLDKEQINLGKDFYKRQRDLSIIATTAFYILQILDATVDAYLFDWAVGDDLSLNIEPAVNACSPLSSTLFKNTLGLRACLSF
jgi:hypothetical protein